MGQASLKTRIPPGFVSRLKSALVPDSIQPRVIPFGLFAGLTMDISFHSRAQPYLGLWEREIAGWTRRFSKGARTALDIGCRDCFYTMFFAKRTEATVLAFDPDPAVATEIARCTALNAVNPGRIRFFQKAVGSEISLDSLLPLDEPIVVKMDTDGGEVGALETASRLLQADCR